ncbi:MAG: hypothetical protein [Caudoviricetes sp.]|nr:MAG: hypothetical protein [Caudoviricetes sp.]
MLHPNLKSFLLFTVEVGRRRKYGVCAIYALVRCRAIPSCKRRHSEWFKVYCELRGL